MKHTQPTKYIEKLPDSETTPIWHDITVAGATQYENTGKSWTRYFLGDGIATPIENLLKDDGGSFGVNEVIFTPDPDQKIYVLQESGSSIRITATKEV